MRVQRQLWVWCEREPKTVSADVVGKLVAVLVAVGAVVECEAVLAAVDGISVPIGVIVVPSDVVTPPSASAAVKTKARRVRVGNHRQHLVVTSARDYFALWSEVSLINIELAMQQALPCFSLLFGIFCDTSEDIITKQKPLPIF